MKPVRCSKGHFYDADKYGSSCPHCAAMTSDVTQDMDDGHTLTVEPPKGDLPDWPPVVNPPSPPSVAAGNEPGTIGMFKKDGDPVVGWLVCTKGSHRGKGFPLRSGRNFIGRGSDMDVCLQGETTVSRNKHAIVLYEPRQRIFLAQMGESHELVYLNGELLLASMQMKAKDRLQIGDVELMLIPCCDADFDWADDADKA